MLSLRRLSALPMAPHRAARVKRAVTVVPLAIVSAAWTVSLVGSGSALVAAPASDPTAPSAPAGAALNAAVPNGAIEVPASVSSPAGGGNGGTGTYRSGAEVREIVATASTNGIPSAALAAYQRAETVINSADRSCHLSWQLLAALGRVESDHGRVHGSALDSDGVARPGIFGIALDGTHGTAVVHDSDAGPFEGDRAFDRAVGPMQFIPATWSVVGVDADSDGVRDPQDIDDAALAAAVYLCSGPGDLATLTGQKAAVLRYNHSASYVALVLDVMDGYLAGDYTAVPDSTSAAGYLTPLPVAITSTPHQVAPARARVSARDWL
ncbi:hypothetical protein BH11ACT8_BH11ACT8_25190 [soil metagenome]